MYHRDLIQLYICDLKFFLVSEHDTIENLWHQTARCYRSIVADMLLHHGSLLRHTPINGGLVPKGHEPIVQVRTSKS